MKEPSNLRPIPGAALGPILRCLLAAALWVLALSSNAQLANSGWPKVHGNAQNTGQGSGSYATSTLQWSTTTVTTGFGYPDPVVGVDGAIYVSGGLNYGSYLVNLNTGSNLYALDGSTGKVKWSYLNSFGYSSPAVGANGMMYVIANGNLSTYTYFYSYLIAFDGVTG